MQKKNERLIYDTKEVPLMFIAFLFVPVAEIANVVTVPTLIGKRIEGKEGEQWPEAKWAHYHKRQPFFLLRYYCY